MSGGRCETTRGVCNGSYVHECSSCGVELAVCDRCDYCKICETERNPVIDY